MKGLVCVNVCACHVKVMSNVKAPESKKKTQFLVLSRAPAHDSVSGICGHRDYIILQFQKTQHSMKAKDGGRSWISATIITQRKLN